MVLIKYISVIYYKYLSTECTKEVSFPKYKSCLMSIIIYIFMHI